MSTEVALNFAIAIDDQEATHAGDCTTQPRQHRALALMRTQANCKTGFDQDHQPLHLHLHRHQIAIDTMGHEGYGWLDRLAESFSFFAMVECSDEGPIAYITTWYFNHQTAQRCEESRPVRLIGKEGHDWHQMILDTWNDQLDLSKPVTISIVKPNPPVVGTESNLLHMILEQSGMPTILAAGIISVIRQDHEFASVHNIAVSMASMTTGKQVLRQVRLEDLCVLRRCKVTYGNNDFLPGQLEDLDAGFCIIMVYVPPLGQSGDILPAKLWTPRMAATMDAHASVHHDVSEDIGFSSRVASWHRFQRNNQPPANPVHMDQGRTEVYRFSIRDKISHTEHAQGMMEQMIG